MIANESVNTNLVSNPRVTGSGFSNAILDDGSACMPDLTATLVKYTVNGMLIIIIFASIIGNILVCIAIYTDRRLRKLSNLFLVSLALADLFVGLLVMTFELANNLMGYWMFGQRFCETWISFDIMCCTASILNLCAISLDRFMHIKDPLRYNQWMTKKVVLLSLAIIWLLSGLISFVPVSLGWHRPSTPPSAASPNYPAITITTSAPSYLAPVLYRKESKFVQNGIESAVLFSEMATKQEDKRLNHPQSGVTKDQQCALDLTPVYAVISSTISFYLPCIIMVALYTRLYLYARKHVQHIRSMSKPLYMNSNIGLTSSDEQQRSGSNGSRTSLPASHPTHSNDHKAAITLGIIMGVFLVCWVPFFCMNIILAFCKTCVPELVFKILTWLGWSNSALNPIIYSIFNTEFRDAFRKILIQTMPDDWRQSIFGTDLRANNHGPAWLSSGRAHHPHHHHHHSSLHSDSNQESSDLGVSPNCGHKRPFKVKLVPPQLVRQDSANRKCTTLIPCNSMKEYSDHGYPDALPIKDRFQILCGVESEDKISAI